ncbi:MAG: DUF2141 domain-containing protein [Crocinitomicaceae bacterium]
MNRWMVNLVLLSIIVVSTSFVRKSNLGNLHTLTVQITNIRNSKGRIQLQIYRNQAAYSKQTPWRVKYVSKDDLKNKTLVYSIPSLESGVYGIAILDDEDQNTKMKYSWLMPDEGFGFSDFYLTGLSSPDFEDFKFNLNGDKTVKVIVKYM